MRAWGISLTRGLPEAGQGCSVAVQGDLRKVPEDRRSVNPVDPDPRVRDEMIVKVVGNGPEGHWGHNGSPTRESLQVQWHNP